MKTLWCFVLAVSVLGIAGLPISQTLAEENILDKRISLDLKDASVEHLYSLFAVILEAELELDNAENDGKVSLLFNEITARTSLNAFCESAGCGWELIEGHPRILRFFSLEQALVQAQPLVEDRPITIDVEDAAAPQVFRLAAKILGTEVFVDPSLDGTTITMRMEEQPVSKVLDQVCNELSCSWTLVEGNPAQLRIDTKGH
jgi:type II secretory pathway component GspD/PulD (secretin)